MNRCLMLAVFLIIVSDSYGQLKSRVQEKEINQNFCNTLLGMVSYAPYKFSAIKGSEIETSPSGTIRYAALKGVTGVKSSCIVNDSAWHYEGVLYEDSSRNMLKGFYEEYARHLEACFHYTGYVLTSNSNPDTRMSQFPDLSYQPRAGGATIELKAERSDINGIYTLTVFVKK